MNSMWICCLTLAYGTLVSTRKHYGTRDDSWRPRGYVPLSPADKALHPRYRPTETRAVFVPPPAFDSIQKWPFCTSIRTIRDQGPCGSCWAVSSASVITDRLCIASGKDIPELISATQANACVRPTFTAAQNCGTGDDPVKALRQAAVYGLASGGLSGSKVGCVPYNVSGLGCATRCTNSAWSIPLMSDTASHIIDSYWSEFSNNASTPSDIAENVLRMKEDIFNNGPLIASIFDLSFNYSSVAPFDAPPPKDLSAGHAIRIIGWNVTATGIPYWNISNSWGQSAGKNGYYWIRMGKNVAGIEQYVSAPIANLSKTVTCRTASFCSAPIDMAVRFNLTNPSSSIHLFQGNCILEVNIKNGKVVASGAAAPIASKIVGSPTPPFTSYVFDDGDLWIGSLSGQAGVGCVQPPLSKKYACMGRGTMQTDEIVSTYYNVSSKMMTSYVNQISQPDWVFIFATSSSATMSGQYISQNVSKLRTRVIFTAFADIDGTKMYVFGKNNTSPYNPVVGLMAYPNAARNSFTWLTPPAVASTLMTC